MIIEHRDTETQRDIIEHRDTETQRDILFFVLSKK